MPRQYATAAAQLSAQEEEDEELVVGSLLEFERSKEYLLGRAIKQLGVQGWQVETASGTVYSVKNADIKYVLPGGATSSAADLAHVAEEAEALSAKEDGLIETAWDISSDAGKDTGMLFTVPNMADLLFARCDPASCAAALHLLRDDKVYFKQAGRNPPMFSPRTASQVESLANSLRLQQAAEAELARFLSDIQQAQHQPRSSKPGEAAWRAGPYGERLAAVEALALGTLHYTGPERTLATQTLAGLGKTPSGQDATELLQSIGWWQPHLQLNLINSGVSEAFEPELEAEAQRLLASPPPDPDAALRRDLTATHSIVTVDDASTTEIDDGVSLERLPDGTTKVWVHVADPSRWVDPESPLAIEARARSKSLYLPTGTVSMFPKCLAEGPFSLRQGIPTAAVSVGMCLSPDGALLADTVEVVPTLVSPARRLTYVDVDEMLEVCDEEQEPDLFQLRQLAVLRRRHRAGCGAVEISMPECAVTVEDAHLEEPAVSIQEEDQFASPARQLVAEMMILAGEAAGELGRRLKVPLPYRGQPEPVLPEPEEMAAVPPGPCQAIMLRMRMTRSQTLTEAPIPHAGLGLDAYVQFTSPIRRYGDLLAHWQLKSVLRGEAAPLQAGPLLEVVEEVGATTQRLIKLERESESYWVAEYFRQTSKRDPRAAWEGMFLCWLKQDVGLGRILLGGLGLETVVRINTPVQPGDVLYVRCSHTDVKAGMFRLELLPPSAVLEGSLVNEGGSSSSYASDAY